MVFESAETDGKLLCVGEHLQYLFFSEFEAFGLLTVKFNVFLEIVGYGSDLNHPKIILVYLF